MNIPRLQKIFEKRIEKNFNIFNKNRYHNTKKEISFLKREIKRYIKNGCHVYDVLEYKENINRDYIIYYFSRLGFKCKPYYLSGLQISWTHWLKINWSENDLS